MMNSIAGLLVIAFALGIPLSGISQAQPQPARDPLHLGTRHRLTSTVPGEERELWIRTPPSYGRSRVGFPVLYVLDADVHFRHATALVDFLAYYLRAPEMIVVGVLNTNRTRDFTPPRAGQAAEAGGADRFLRFMTEEVRKYVNREFRAEPFSVLVGHSLGGLFAVNTLAQQPAAFSAYIAISPSLYWNDSAVVEAMRRSVVAEKDRPAGFLYLALGEAEPPTIATSTRSLRATLQTSAPESLRWNFAEFGRENHLTVPYPALHGALRWLFDLWLLPIDPTAARIAAEGKLDAFDAHFVSLSKRYGYNVQPTELVISMIGDRLYRSRDFDEAISLFRRRVQLYPESPEAHDELARGYEAAGQRALALESYERAYALAASQKHPSLGAIRGRLERIRR